MAKQPYAGQYPNVKKYLEKGDKGTEVTKLQNYLNWYTDGEFFKKCGGADGIYGNNTFQYTKKMQTDFFGAKEADGLVGPKTIAKMKAYSDSFKPKPKPTPTPSGTYPGTLPTYRLVKSNAQVIADTIKWAKWIAGNNNFHYGWGQHSHHNGCYFCGTQPSSKKSSGIKQWQTTYCCNPFVHAAWAHGGCVPKALSICSSYGSWDFGTGSGSYHTSSLFTKVSTSSLKPGDVLCSDSHVALYIGNGQVVQAGHSDDNVPNSSDWNSSISIGRWNGYSRAYRFNSSVNADVIMMHGEVSDRVALWQAFLDWYYDGKVGKPYDGIYGDNTFKWTKQFQEEVIGKGQGDGTIGPKTLAAAAAVKK